MHRSILSRGATALAALVLATAGAAALAQTPAVPAAPAATAAMNFQQIIERVVAQGYNDVREIERKSDKLYEIKARKGQGRWVELYVDARSGEILREDIQR